ncbi:hypothetical protein E9993_17135 [Labilibacter sediminis]|nr:hypothetical protein E9993_17135 [Labilibacter sediminis]
MINLEDIEINKFQLNGLLNHHEKQGFKYLLENGVFCATCNDYCKYSVSNYKLYLDRFNDIKVSGNCSLCNGKVEKVMEFGDNESFFRKAVQFRNKMAALVESE